MYLKRLELQGFKTFADRTEIELTPGITAVVGPNGVGKSNILDAILWALGEQNVRSLRGVKTQDVIFAGSDKRKATGMAEVTMTVDNSSGKLPIEFAEVQITRRAYRLGDGEYFINKTPCRLKDIYELFLDTGVGREAYSMVTQGEIDAALSAKPEDRRALFEEAAGIKKYRYRRKEATKKLENTEANLRRVNDIVAELSSQIEPMREQAEVAARYNELVERLREIEVGLLISDLRRRSTELNEVRASRGDGGTRIAEYDEQLLNLEIEKEELQKNLAELERRIDTSRSGYQELSSERQRLESLATLTAERSRTADETCKTLDAEITALETRREETRERLCRLEIESSGAAERESELAARIAELTRQAQELDSQIEEASRQVDDQKANYIELAKEDAARRTEAENAKARVAALNATLAKLTSELDAARKQKDDVSAKARAAAESLDSLKKQLEETTAALEKARASRSELEARLDEESKAQAELNKYLLEKASRLRALKEMAESHEGFFEGVRSVMAAAKSGKLGRHFAVVADVITVPEGFATAIAVALGSSVQDIVADSVDDAKHAIEFLKKGDAGRATFLPLNGIRPTVSSIIGDVEKAVGYLGMAADILDYDKKYTPAVNLLLGKVVVVETIDHAIKLRRSASGWSKIVTLDGEVILPTGAISGGSRASRGPNLIARKQEMDALAAEVRRVEADYDARETRLTGLREEVTQAAADINALDESTGKTRVALAESEQESAFLAQEMKRLEREDEVVSAEKELAEGQLAEEEDALRRLQEELRLAGQENVDLDEIVARAQNAVETLQAERRELGDELLKQNVELAAARERRSSQSRAATDASAAVDEITSQIEIRRGQREKAEIDSAANAKERQAALIRLDEQSTVYEAAGAALAELVENRNNLTERVNQADHDLRTITRSRNELSELIHDADIKEARLEVQLSQIKTRLLDEYEISEEEATAWPEYVEVERGTATEVGKLRKEIREMGAVNIGACQEYERLKERWDFLSTQKADLIEARDSLTGAIEEIDGNTHDLFMHAFRAVADAFDVTFKRLFGGGQTQLVLTDPEDLLETGIEIIVQPPGKNLQNMTLLSGGEKALTATALIFALMRVRPSPFCVMDEVDAPLDEANVERFAELVRDMSDSTQFIVITHNRATMEAADSLYGVTMQEPGISKLVSVTLAGREAAEPFEEPAILAPETVSN